MKKKIILSAAAIAVFGWSNQADAQRIYNTCASHIAYGTQVYGGRITTCDTTGVTAKAGGENVTWDYSGLVTTKVQYGDTTCYIDPSTAPGGGLFAGANICSYKCNSAYANENSAYTFGGGNADSTYSLGSFAVTVSTTGTLVDTVLNVDRPPMVFQHCPFAYGDSFPNTYSKVEHVGNTVANMLHGTSTTTYAGYGTLILPAGTYPNASLLRITKNEVDSSLTGVGTYNVMVMHSTTFEWVDSAGNSLIIYLGTITMGTLVINQKSVMYVGANSGALTNTISAAAPHNNNAMTVYPASATGEFVIRTSGFAARSIEVFSMQGKRVYRSAINGRTEKFKIDAPKGIYFIRLKTEGGTLLDKLIIDR